MVAKTNWTAGEQVNHTKLNQLGTDINTAQTTADGKYSKPSLGIPKTDLTTAVQNSLTLADGAAQAAGLTELIQDVVAAFLTQGTNVTLTYNDVANTLTVTAAGGPGGGGGLDAEAVRDAIGVALVGLGNISVVVNDTLDTITITTSATQNSTDAQLRDRATHTGSQDVSTIANLAEYIQDTVAAFVIEGTGITKTYNDGANTLTLTASGGGGGASTPGVRVYLGSIAADGFQDITHNLGFDVDIVFTRSWLQSANGAVTGIPIGQVVDMTWFKLNDATVRVSPSVAIGNKEIIADIAPRTLTSPDVLGPSAGVLTSPAQGLTTVDLLLTGGTDLPVGGDGLAGIFWYRSAHGAGTPALIGTSPGISGADTFQDTGRAPSTHYDYTAKRFDLLGHPGLVSNLLDQDTLAPSNVVPIGTPVQNRSAGSGSVGATPVYAAGSLRIAVAAVSVSHTEWVPSSGYTLAVAGSQSGGWTPGPMPGSPLPDVGGASFQPSGGCHYFYKLVPNLAWTTDLVTFTATPISGNITPVNAMISIRQYAFVDQLTPFNVSAVDLVSNPASLGVASAVGDYTMCVSSVHGGSGSPAGTYTQTLIGSIQGAVVAGYAHYLVHGEAATTVAGTIVHGHGPFSAAHATIVANIKKA
jgi:hypothetical protein